VVELAQLAVGVRRFGMQRAACGGLVVVVGRCGKKERIIENVLSLQWHTGKQNKTSFSSLSLFLFFLF
jgi:hypothetical protein